MAITSQVRSPPAFGEAPVRDWKAAGLLKPSVIKPVIATLEQRLVRKILGQPASSPLMISGRSERPSRPSSGKRHRLDRAMQSRT
jgi:hypothetical protein